MSPSRHIPMRRCVVCRRSLPQAEMIRLGKGADGMWRLDLARRLQGRGAWLCQDAACHQTKKLKRFFRVQAGDIAAGLGTLDQALNPQGRIHG